MAKIKTVAWDQKPTLGTLPADPRKGGTEAGPSHPNKSDMSRTKQHVNE